MPEMMIPWKPVETGGGMKGLGVTLRKYLGRLGKIIKTHTFTEHICKLNPAQKVSAQIVSGHKVSKIDNIGQKVSTQKYLNKDNEHYHFTYYIINSVVGSRANRK